jgi:hypothetical protein
VTSRLRGVRLQKVDTMKIVERRRETAGSTDVRHWGKKEVCYFCEEMRDTAVYQKNDMIEN